LNLFVLIVTWRFVDCCVAAASGFAFACASPSAFVGATPFACAAAESAAFALPPAFACAAPFALVSPFAFAGAAPFALAFAFAGAAPFARAFAFVLALPFTFAGAAPFALALAFALALEDARMGAGVEPMLLSALKRAVSFVAVKGVCALACELTELSGVVGGAVRFAFGDVVDVDGVLAASYAVRDFLSVYSCAPAAALMLMRAARYSMCAT
jgi:hypothetical protein